MSSCSCSARVMNRHSVEGVTPIRIKKIVRFSHRRQPHANSIMIADTELLRRYVEERSEPAFAALVQRHLGLVYSVALRRVGGDAHLAEDVAQQVFVDLARKGRILINRATLAGWLYAGAHVASAAIVRRERRRKTRELQAQSMHATDSNSVTDAELTRVRPLVDEAFISLK